jgi:hypothetical protein
MIPSKGKKRESMIKYKSKFHHIQHKEDVPHGNVKMAWKRSKFPKMSVANNKSKIRGSSTVLSHYHYRCDPNLGNSKCAMRRISCLRQACTDQLDEDWIPGVESEKQLCYAPVLNCKYNQILGNYNNWIIMPFNATEDTGDDDLIEIQESIIQGIADDMAGMVNENNFGAVNTNDPETKGFYIVKFTSLPYTSQENIVLDNELIKEGSLVCEVEYMSPAQEGSLWYLIPKEGTISTVVDMGKVLIARLSVSVITSESQLDRSMSNLTLSNIIERKPFK